MPAQSPTPADWKAVASLLVDAAAADSISGITEVVVRQAHPLLAAEICICDQFDSSARQQAFVMHPTPTLSFLQKAHPPFLAFWHQHPYQRDWTDIFGSGGVAFLSDGISSREFRRTALWNEVYIQLRAKNQIMVGGQIEPDRYWCLSLNRLGSNFTPRDRALCHFLQPRISRLLQRQARRDRANRTLAALAHDRAAYLVVDASGQMLEASAQAQALLTQSGPATGKALPQFSARQAPTGIRTEKLGGLQALLLRTAPSAPAFVLLGATAPAVVSHAPPLTPREAEILNWLGQGKTNPQIAAVMDISPRTVEKHCEHLFAKLGVESRLSAALLANQRR